MRKVLIVNALQVLLNIFLFSFLMPYFSYFAIDVFLRCRVLIVNALQVRRPRGGAEIYTEQTLLHSQQLLNIHGGAYSEEELEEEVEEEEEQQQQHLLNIHGGAYIQRPAEAFPNTRTSLGKPIPRSGLQGFLKHTRKPLENIPRSEFAGSNQSLLEGAMGM